MAHVLLQDPEAASAAVKEAAKVGGQLLTFISLCVPSTTSAMHVASSRLQIVWQPALLSCNQVPGCTAVYLQVSLSAEERKQRIADRRAAYCSRHPEAQDPASMDATVRRAVKDLRRSERGKLRQRKEKRRLAAKEARAEELEGVKQVPSDFKLGCRPWLTCL